MSKKLVIFGVGEQAEVIQYYFDKHSDYEIAAFTVDGEHVSEDSFWGKPVIEAEEISQQFSPDTHDAYVAIGYNKLNHLRAEKYHWMKGLGYSLANYISEKATVLTDKIGDNVLILEENTIQPFVEVGNNVVLWSGNHIGHHTIIRDHVFVASHIVCSGGVDIGEYSFLGVNATLRDHITIGPKNIIGAGAILLKSTGENEVYPGKHTDKIEGLEATSLKRI
ncbi:acetyltransferase [Temperatibacter marinus]|uniref:Acetyltransferase n=1 Tax=Temperatibacter marinus TaxID=1456591 RepID=A0AA52EEG2_9PROT|nr:acetyltransferase [Temperatibacter marinus]WND03210.1 acetyltransferase [Temperatibacter marinus]